VSGITTNGTAFGETWADGDEIYYNPVTGNPTNVKPVAPNIKVSVGTLIKAGAGGSGSIQVEINHGSVLGGTDANVQINGVSNGQILSYDGGNGYWKNTDLTAGTGISISETANGVLTVANTVTGGITITDNTSSASTFYPALSAVTTGTITGATTSSPKLSFVPSTGVLSANGVALTGNTGTVTSTSVVSANGFAGTVATSTTTPAITISTSITGVLKGNGTAISAATLGTDYSAGTSALGTGILKSTTTTGALTIAVAADFPTLNQNTTGTASNVTGTVAIANGGTGATTATAAFDALNPMTTTGDIIYEASATTAARLGIGTAGQVLTVVAGLPAWAAAGGGSSFPATTKMLFQQTSAPTGWTKITTTDNAALRLVSGSVSSGGTVDFTTAFAANSVGATTLSTAQLASHNHFVGLDVGSATTQFGTGTLAANRSSFTYCGSNNNGPNTSSTGSGSSHTHSYQSLAVKYVDVIIASKD
jgi:hypothetical protein